MKLTFKSMFAKLRTCELLLFLNFAGQIIKKLKFQDMPEIPRHLMTNFFSGIQGYLGGLLLAQPGATRLFLLTNKNIEIIHV